MCGVHVDIVDIFYRGLTKISADMRKYLTDCLQISIDLNKPLCKKTVN